MNFIFYENEGHVMMHKIEVDEDVWAFMKKHAEPFEDSPNSVLRRLLLAANYKSICPQNEYNINNEMPTFPAGVPLSLQQILEVAYAVKKLGYTRNEATNLVSKKRGIAPQTVIDKYCRRLNKKAFEIDNLLYQNFDKFKTLLENNFINHRENIDNFFEKFLK